MNITLLAKKGGVGKSTVSVLLYEAFRQAGKSVSIHDWDAQGTSSKAMELIHASNPQVKAEQAGIVIYDTPPSLEHTATATAVRSADIVLIVTSPSPADIWEADDAVRFAKSKNSKAAVRVVFNKVRKSTVLGRLVEESGKQLSAPVLKVSLSARECYQHAVAQGCELRCAARGTEMYSGKPTASVVVSELAAESGVGQIEGRRRLNDAGQKAVELTADRLTSLVDEILATKASAKPLVSITAPPEQPKVVGCACGSGIPVQTVSIEGRPVELLALSIIFSHLRERGRAPDVVADELMANVEIYNAVPADSKAAYRTAILREYVAYWRGGMR